MKASLLPKLAATDPLRVALTIYADPAYREICADYLVGMLARRMHEDPALLLWRQEILSVGPDSVGTVVRALLQLYAPEHFSPQIQVTYEQLADVAGCGRTTVRRVLRFLRDAEIIHSASQPRCIAACYDLSPLLCLLARFAPVVEQLSGVLTTPTGKA